MQCVTRRHIRVNRTATAWRIRWFIGPDATFTFVGSCDKLNLETRVGTFRARALTSMDTISWNDFLKVELRVGRVVRATAFPEARKPAYVLHVDFGPELGIRKSSVQITTLYTTDELVGRLVVAVVNFPPKQVGPLMSECLVTGFPDESGNVVLCVPDREVSLGSRLF